MEFKQLQSFVAVIRCGSFTEAAEELFLSQPTISIHIRQLEEELHTQLLIRTTKRVKPTPKGEQLYEYAQSILELRDRIVQACSETGEKIIHLGASTIPSAYILPEILPKYGAIAPNTYFVIHQGDSQDVAKGLLEGLYDLGLTGMRTEEERLDYIPFCKDRMVLIPPVNQHFLALKARKDVPIAELLRGPVILREKGSGSRKSADRFLEQAGIAEEDLQVVARVNDQEAVKNLVAGGLGVSILSQRAARNFQEERRVLAFELPELTASRNLYLVSRRGVPLSEHVRHFAEFVQRESL